MKQKKLTLVAKNGNYMKFLKDLRLLKGLSRAKAVRLMGNVSEGTLQYWEEKAKDLSFENACKIAEAYNVSLDDLKKMKEKEAENE